MTNTKHTPAPWVLTKPTHGLPANGLGIYSADLKSYIAATTDWSSSKELNNEMICNARLIAAAPELLEALEVAEAELENHTNVPGVSEHVLPCIRAAIAKAKGEA